MTALVAMLLEAAPPEAPALVLTPGHAAIIRPLGEDRMVIVERDPPQARRPQSDELRLEMRMEGGKTILSVLNGRARMIAYRAILTRDGGVAEPTSVCWVPPGKVVIEYWPYPVAALALAKFRDLADNESSIRCE